MVGWSFWNVSLDFFTADSWRGPTWTCSNCATSRTGWWAPAKSTSGPSWAPYAGASPKRRPSPSGSVAGPNRHFNDRLALPRFWFYCKRDPEMPTSIKDLYFLIVVTRQLIARPFFYYPNTQCHPLKKRYPPILGSNDLTPSHYHLFSSSLQFYWLPFFSTFEISDVRLKIGRWSIICYSIFPWDRWKKNGSSLRQRTS